MEDPPSPALDGDALRNALVGTRFAAVRLMAETGSTNADALAAARARGEPEGLVVVAEHQTAGRGRFDRRWEAPARSSLLVSVLTRPGPLGLGPDDVHLVATAVGVAAAEAARSLAAADVRLKWPNDLVIGDRKLAGLLGESVIGPAGVEALVVGLGLNVNWPAELPDDLAGSAVALNHVAGHDIDRSALLVDLLRRLDGWYRAVATDVGRAGLLARYRELSATIGRRVQVDLPGGTLVGDAVDVDGDGHLLVVDDCPDQPRQITAGDVIHLRPAG